MYERSNEGCATLLLTALMVAALMILTSWARDLQKRVGNLENQVKELNENRNR